MGSRLSGGGMDTRGLSRLLFLSSSISTSSTLLPSSSSHLLSPSTPFFSSLLLLSRSPHGAVGAPDEDLLSQPTSNFVNTEPSKFLDGDVKNDLASYIENAVVSVQQSGFPDNLVNILLKSCWSDPIPRCE